MKKYVAAFMVLLFLLLPISGYAATSFTLNLSAKEVQRGGEITLSGTTAGDSDDVVLKIVSPNQTVFYLNAITAGSGIYSQKIIIPSVEDLAPYGIYSVIAGSGGASQNATFTVKAKPVNSPQPSAPTAPNGAAGDGTAIPPDAGEADGSLVQPELSKGGHYVVGSDTLAEAVKQASDAVTIELPAAAGESGSALEFPAKSLDAMKDKSLDLIVAAGNRTVRFPAGSFPVPNDDSSSRLHIALNAAWNAAAQALVEQSIKSNTDYRSTGAVLSVVIQLISGSTVTEIHQLDKPATVTLKLTEQQAKLISEVLAGVYYVDGKTAEYTAGTVKNGTFTFNARHFSYYAILEYNKTFDDLKGHWAEDAVKLLTAKHIVNGIDDQHYAPNRSITRAEFVTLVMRAIEQSGNTLIGQGPVNAFTDVPAGQYYTQQVADAAALDIVTGYNGKFRPGDSITREEAVVAMVRAADYFHLSTVKQGQPFFADANSISVWAAAAVERAWTKGLIQGDGSKFNPGSPVTRAEVAVMIQRLITDSSI